MSDELENKIRELSIKYFSKTSVNKKLSIVKELDELYKLYLLDKYPKLIEKLFDYKRLYFDFPISYKNIIIINKFKETNNTNAYVDKIKYYEVIEAEYLCNPITFTFESVSDPKMYEENYKNYFNYYIDHHIDYKPKYNVYDYSIFGRKIDNDILFCNHDKYMLANENSLI